MELSNASKALLELAATNEWVTMVVGEGVDGSGPEVRRVGYKTPALDALMFADLIGPVHAGSWEREIRFQISQKGLDLWRDLQNSTR